MKKFFAFLAVIATAFLLLSCGGGGGYSGVQKPPTQLRMTPSLSAVGLAAGTFSDVAKISQGVPPYQVITSAGTVASARILGDGTLRMFGTLPGTATVTVQDSSVNQQSIPLAVTVKAMPPLYVDPPVTSITLPGAAGATFYFTVGGGMPPYSVSSGGLVSVACDPASAMVNGYCASHAYVATAGSQAGTDTITITDQYRFGDPPGVIAIAVTVQKPTPLNPLAVNPSALAGKISAFASAVISGGFPPYQVASSNPGVASVTPDTVSRSGLPITVNFLTAGTAEIGVTDSTGASVKLGVTVKAETLVVLPPSATLGNPTGAGAPAVTFAISGGSMPYKASVDVAGDTYVTASVSGSTLIVARDVTCLAVGALAKAVPVTITDDSGQTAKVNVVLQYSATAMCP